MLSELTKLDLSSNTIVSVNGEQPIPASQINPETQIQKLQVVEGSFAVGANSTIEEDWSKLSSQTTITVELLNNQKVDTRALVSGDAVELVVTIDQGYKDGDLLWVYLPEALSRVYGGAQIKMFSVDFKGGTESFHSTCCNELNCQ